MATEKRVLSHSLLATWQMGAADLARVVAQNRGYTVRGNVIKDEKGRNVAMGYAHLADKMVRAGWIKPGKGVYWTRIHAKPTLPKLSRDYKGWL